MPSAAASRTIRPALKFQRPGQAVAALAVMTSVVWLSSGLSVVVLVPVLAAGAGLGLGIFALQIRISRFGIEDDLLVHRGLLGRRVIARSSEPVRVTRIPREDQPDAWWQVWQGPIKAITLAEDVWGAEALDRLAEEWGAEKVDSHEAQSIFQIAEEHPAAMPWIARHYWLVPLVCGLVVAALVVWAVLSEG